jgi:hypothetical protein
MRMHRLFLVSLAATVAVSSAWAQNRGAAGTASGLGTYSFPGTAGPKTGAGLPGLGSSSESGLGGFTAGATPGATPGAATGINGSGAGTGTYAIQGNGLTAGGSALPSLGAPPPSSATGNGFDGPPPPPRAGVRGAFE